MESREKCCIFDNPNIRRESILLRMKSVKELSRESDRRWTLYRCDNCGAYVLYNYEEVNCHWSGFNWDDLDMYHRFYPVCDVEESPDGVTKFKYASDDELSFFEHYYDK